MCTHQRLIYSPYLRYPIYVKCGKCKSCLQEKAQLRTKRIHHTYKKGLICMMATLTYSRFNAPYILRDEAFDFAHGKLTSLNVYRDIKYRKVRKPKDNDDYFQDYKKIRGQHVLDTIDFVSESTLKGTKDMKHEHDRIGVCYYADYQRFMARLRLNLIRHYDFQDNFFVYACSEYGCRSFRPHFHLLFFIPDTSAKIFKDAIYESWPFSNLRRFDHSVEVATNAASYVASYVNSGSKFPMFFKTYCKQKHSYSKGFGCNYSKFSLDSLLRMFQQGSFKYSVLKTIQGVPTTFDVPVPSYVISRYFPKFKGFSRISPTEVVTYMHRFAKFENPYLDKLPFDKPVRLDLCGFYGDSPALYWSDDEVVKIGVCLNNAYKRFCDCYPDRFNLPTLDDYFNLHVRVWRTFNSTLLRLQMEDTSVPLEEHFDNLDVFFTKDDKLKDKFLYTQGVKILVAAGLNPDLIKTCNPNEFESVKRVSTDHASWFDEHIKHRNVSNEIYISQQEDCEL